MNSFDASNSSYVEASVQSFIQRVYQWMTVGLGLTGAIALWTSHHPEVVQTISSGGMFLVLILAQLGIVFWLSASIMRLSVPVAILGYAAYAALNGLLLSFIFLVYTGASIASTFFYHSGDFCGHQHLWMGHQT
jgi:FtsH-binding integral membrane protein